VPSPCPGPTCALPPDHQPQAVGLRIVYLNFDGVTLKASNATDDALANESAILTGAVSAGQTRAIAPFNVNDLDSTEGLTREEIISRVVEELYASHAPYNIEFVTQRPASGNYSMVVFGGSCQTVAGQSGCAGIALLDCGDFMPANITFVFPAGLRISDLAATAAQEEAHAFGLVHTVDTTDIMYPYLQNFIPTQFGSGSVPEGDSQCGGQAYQNSDEKMMQTIGYRGQDTLGPTITITAPAPGATIAVGDAVAADITDPSSVGRAVLMVNGFDVAEKTAPPWSFTLPEGTTPGNVTITVKAYDAAPEGNVAEAVVQAYLLTGDEQPCAEDGTCAVGLECVGGLCVPGEGGLGTVCTGNEECDSMLCAELEGEHRCSQACNEATPCPAGFECAGDIACWPKSDDGGGGGCAAGNDGGGGLGALWLLALGAMLLRRRRSAR
jgi:MYXO-CTERM domain-containing protein